MQLSDSTSPFTPFLQCSGISVEADGGFFSRFLHFFFYKSCPLLDMNPLNMMNMMNIICIKSISRNLNAVEIFMIVTISSHIVSFFPIRILSAFYLNPSNLTVSSCSKVSFVHENEKVGGFEDKTISQCQCKVPP